MAFEVNILESSKELTARERIRLKDTTDAVKLDEATQKNPVIIKPVAYAILGVHNDMADDKDYEQYIIEDADGTKYVTGSESFWNSFKNIYDEMKDEDEDWSVKAYRVPSKNYTGRDFISCSLM